MIRALIPLCLLCVSPLWAQDVIVVTGDRSGERPNETVSPITLIDRTEILNTGAQHPAELINRAPGAFLHRGNGAEHLTAIRSPVLTGGAGAGAFLYLEDGIPLRAAGFSNVNGLFEALSGLSGNVEVFRGPGPAHYGSNALHGLIHFRTPEPGSTPQSIEIEAGSFGRVRGQAIWTGTHERTSWLTGLAGQHEEGWRAESGLDRLEALVRADGTAPHFDWRFTLSGISLNQETAGFIRGSDAYRDRTLARSNPDPEGFRDAYAIRTALRLDGHWQDLWNWSLTPYARSNAMDFRMHFLPSEALEESGHDSLGLQAALVRETDDSRLTIGADLERTWGYLTETQERPTIFSFVQGDHYDYTVTADVAALYAQGRWALTPSLTAQLGARWEVTRYVYDNHLPDNTVGRFLRLPDRSDDFSVLTPHAGLIWQVSDASAVFARLARGSRTPQTAELYRLQPGQDITGIEPEVLDSAELGLRHAFARGGRVELVAYAMRKTNVFFRDADGFNVTDGATRHHGVEFDLAWPLSGHWEFEIAGSWADHRYDFDRVVGNATETIRDGNRVDTAPEWLWNTRLSWRPTDRFQSGLEWVHVGEYFTDAANQNRYDGHDLLNLRARFAATDRITLFGTIRNLTDERYAERADFAFGSERYFPGEARAFSLGVRFAR
ncbi:TonB-dependent receptor [Hyphobacterium sp.]|uniref:TonB-dependent receptor n=1 Tax=Hyphobacterium sp. TaxID=2004662 RepID=UPI003BA86BA9